MHFTSHPNPDPPIVGSDLPQPLVLSLIPLDVTAVSVQGKWMENGPAQSGNKKGFAARYRAHTQPRGAMTTLVLVLAVAVAIAPALALAPALQPCR